MHSPNPDHICGLCDEFDVGQAAPEYAALGMARCMVQSENPPLSAHVSWDGSACVSFRLDRTDLHAKRQFVEAQRRAAATTEGREQ